MLRLTSQSLPTVRQTAEGISPLVRVYKSRRRSLAPIARVNSRRSPDDGDVDISLTDPDYFGVCASVDMGSDSPTINRILLAATGESLTIQSSALKSLPHQVWISGSTLSAFLFKAECNPFAVLYVEAISFTKLPQPNSQINYDLDLSDWGSFVASQVWAEGTLFQLAPNSSNPKTGQFVQTGTAIRLYGSSSYQPASFCTVEVHLTKSVTVTPTYNFAVFDFSKHDIESLDSVEYLGDRYTPAQDPASPILGEFLWKYPYLTLVMDLSVNLQQQRQAGSKTSSISQITYFH